MDVDVDMGVDVRVDIGPAISSYIYQCIVKTKGYTSLRCVLIVVCGPAPIIEVGAPTGPEQTRPSGQHPIFPLLPRKQ